MNGVIYKLSTIGSVALISMIMPSGQAPPVVPTPVLPGAVAPRMVPGQTSKAPVVEQTWNIYQRAGEKAFIDNDISGARRYLKAALKLATNHEQRLQSIVALADLYESQSELGNERITLLQLAQELKDDPVHMTELAQVYAKLGAITMIEHKPISEKFYWMSVHQYEKAKGTDNYDYAMALISLGMIEQHKHKFADAEQCLLKARHLFEKKLGVNNYNSAMAAASLGDLYVDWGKPQKAQAYYLNAAKELETIFGPTDQTVLMMKRKFKQAGGNYHHRPDLKNIVDWIPIAENQLPEHASDRASAHR